MAKGDRTGNRKTREQRRTIKVPELGYYLIVTDTEEPNVAFLQDCINHCRRKLETNLSLKS